MSVWESEYLSTGLFDDDNDDQFYFPGIGDELEDIDVPSAPEEGCPPPEQWADVEASFDATKFTIDQAKQDQWDLAKNEITHLRSRFSELCEKEEENVVLRDIFDFYVGSKSKFGSLMKNELGIDDELYFKFMHTACLQAAMNQSPTQLFFEKSPVSTDLVMMKEEYVKMWRDMSVKGKMDAGSYFGEGRREPHLWEKAERCLNEMLHSLSITNRRGTIAIALDDDKVWVAMTNLFDTFGVKYTTHTKDNRKGIVIHTAISTGAQVPINGTVERVRDSAVSCFTRMIQFLFHRDGGGEDNHPNLLNVLIGSDRGYMLVALVFSFLIHCGCRVIGTTKRVVQGWPFTFNQKVKKDDKRKMIDENGAPTLYVKKIKKDHQTLFATAFRNGSGKVNTTISSIHRNHHWEGVAYSPSDAEFYHSSAPNVRSTMVQRAMARVEKLGLPIDPDCEELVKKLRENEVKVVTMLQGKK